VGHRDSHQEARGLAPPHASPSAAGHHPHPPSLPQHHPPPDSPRPYAHTLGQPEVEAGRQQQHSVACQPYALEPELHPPPPLPLEPLDALNALS